MLWRLWTLLSGLPLGALVALALVDDPAHAAMRLAWGAVGGALALGLVVSLLARWRDDEPDRGQHLAAAASAAWLALPAALAIWLTLAPGRWFWVAVTLVWVALMLFRGSREIGPAAGTVRWGLRAGAWAAAGTPAVLVFAGIWSAAAGARVPEPGQRWVDTIYDMDAAVATRPLPACSQTPREVHVLLDRGAHPSLSPDGRFVWFDAAVAEEGGRRQIHRLEQKNGSVECWSCGEPGNNVRPRAGDSGLAIVFETDRNASWLHPDDRDVQIAAVHHPHGSQQLTFDRSADERPLLGPGSRIVLWSQRADGRYRVVAAALRSGHGGLLLGKAGVIARGGAEWTAPLAWSRDGRTLIVGHGNPFAPVAAFALDPASGAKTPLGRGLAPAAAFAADGGWLALATAEGGYWAGALPSALGFVMGPWASARARTDPLLQETGLLTGPRSDPSALAPLALPAPLAGWGAPSGLAYAPDGSWLVLGQRRRTPAGIEERLVEVTLDCDGGETKAASTGETGH